MHTNLFADGIALMLSKPELAIPEVIKELNNSETKSEIMFIVVLTVSNFHTKH